MRALLMSAMLLAAAPAAAAENSLTVNEGKLAPLTAATDQSSEMLELSCDSMPSRTFCRDIRQFDSLLINCTGTACYSVWDAQLNKIDEIEYWYDRNVYRGDRTSCDIGADARIVAQRLCSVRLTGDARYLTALAISYNNLLAILNDMQTMAGVRFPHTCRFNLD